MTEQTQSIESPNLTDPAVPVLLFGRDAKGKPHGSTFSAAEAPLAIQAAGRMGLKVLRLVSDQEIALAEGIAQGRLFRSGAFVPFLAAHRFAALEAAPGAITPERPADALKPPMTLKRAKGRRTASTQADAAEHSPTPASEAAEAHGDPAAIRVGSLVLACEDGEAGTWWVARIISDRDPDTFELRWGGEWQDEPSFTRQRDHVAVLPPAFADKPS